MEKELRQHIRKCYKKVQKELESGEYLSPYDLGIDWMTVFSPIEDNVWGHIRYLGLPLYPQYPVGPYFVDFADPHKKVGIEVDSIKWHKDIEKDQEREKKINRMGWRLYRFPSRITFKCRDDYADEDGNMTEENSMKYFSECSEGILIKIYQHYLENRKMYTYILDLEKGDN